MRTIEDQLRAYTVKVESQQQPVTVEEALALVEPVRVSDTGTHVAQERGRRQGILVAISVAATVLLLLGSTFFLRARVDDTEVGTAPTTAPTPITTVAPEPTQSIETHLGTWTWQEIDPPITGPVTEYNGIFYSADGYRAFDRTGQPIPPEDRNPENWLLTSNDSITWERTLLPDEMRGLILSIGSDDEGLIIWGSSDLDTRRWTSLDGATWTAQSNLFLPRFAESNPLGLTIPGIQVEGVEMQIDTENPVSVGDVQLVQGRVRFIFPEELYTFFRRSYSVSEEQASDARSGSIEFLDVSTETVLYGISYAAQGTSIGYTAWNGAVGDTDVIHTARIDLGSDTLVEQLIESGPISAQLDLLWRSTGRGELFVIVDDPFESLTLLEPDSRNSAFDTLLVRDGQFVAYGTLPGGPTTTINENVTRNEPSTIAAIATSSDGLAWTITEIPELVNPRSVETLGDGRVVWSGEFGFWISDDGLTGAFISLGAESDGVESAFGALISITDSGFRISSDGRQWSRIAFPQQVANGTTDFSIEGDRAFYIVTPDGGETTSWVGYLKP